MGLERAVAVNDKRQKCYQNHAMHRPVFSWGGRGVGWEELGEELGGVLPT